MVVVDSKCNQGVLDWLAKQMNRESVAEPCAKLAGERQAHLSNVATALEAVAPQRLAVAVKVDASAHLEEIDRLLGTRSCT